MIGSIQKLHVNKLKTMNHPTKKRRSIFIGVLSAMLIISLFVFRNLFDDNQQISRFFDGWYLIGEIALILFITWFLERKK